jgi:hypothetical protein
LTAGNFTIYCDSGTGEGIVVQSDEVSGLSYVDKKELIGAGGTVLAIDSFGGVTTDVVFDSTSGSRLLIKDRILFRAHAPVVTIRIDGDGFLYLSEITSGTGVTPPTTLNVYNQGTVTDDPDRCVLEHNNLEQVITQEYTSMKFESWSGKYTSVKKTVSDAQTDVTTNVVSFDRFKSGPTNIANWFQADVGSYSPLGARIHLRAYFEDTGAVNEYARIDLFRLPAGPHGSYVSISTEDTGSTMQEMIRFYSDGTIYTPLIKKGINQGASGAGVDEIWVDTSAGNVLKLGV